jgi:hypothetical protein
MNSSVKYKSSVVANYAERGASGPTIYKGTGGIGWFGKAKNNANKDKTLSTKKSNTNNNGSNKGTKYKNPRFL